MPKSSNILVKLVLLPFQAMHYLVQAFLYPHTSPTTQKTEDKHQLWLEALKRERTLIQAYNILIEENYHLKEEIEELYNALMR